MQSVASVLVAAVSKQNGSLKRRMYLIGEIEARKTREMKIDGIFTHSEYLFLFFFFN